MSKHQWHDVTAHIASGEITTTRGDVIRFGASDTTVHVGVRIVRVAAMAWDCATCFILALESDTGVGANVALMFEGSPPFTEEDSE